MFNYYTLPMARSPSVKSLRPAIVGAWLLIGGTEILGKAQVKFPITKI